MSLPVTSQEKAQAAVTQAQAGPAENLASTACPQCGVRFALLARLDAAGWHLRCTRCWWAGDGALRVSGASDD